MLDYTIPVLLIVLLGAWLKRSRFAPDGFFPAIEWFSFFVAFPALLFVNTARLQFSGTALRDLTAATLLPTLAMVALLVAMLPLARRLPDPSRSSIIQGAVRPSTYFGLAVASLLFEDATAALVMLALAICLPVVNVVAVVALAWWSGTRVSASGIAMALAKNPIIVATIAGALVNVSGLALPASLANGLDIVGSASLALGLVCVGGGLDFRWSSARPLSLGVTSALKLLALPLLAVGICRLLGADDMVTRAACFYAALPTASNAYIMARQMGGDAPLMASLITLQTLLAIATVPLALHIPGWLAAIGT
ncbi:AEC family transporter [Luteimonas terrae]|uniref:AEC family transporter n=1 Tax=Luteimonas terrae TaxID=1530191 RepID=A0A4R5UBQ8_9GAMM|nr:AEC family transporter [Luteimonas terrae]TDK32658.1 AEC family transporter [Luteimonas terrae]